jgi:hypothetical protein
MPSVYARDINYQFAYLDFCWVSPFEMMKKKGDESHQSSFWSAPTLAHLPTGDCRTKEIDHLPR